MVVLCHCAATPNQVCKKAIQMQTCSLLSFLHFFHMFFTCRTVAPHENGRVTATRGNEKTVAVCKAHVCDMRRVTRILFELCVLGCAGKVKQLDKAKVVCRCKHLQRVK